MILRKLEEKDADGMLEWMKDEEAVCKRAAVGQCMQTYVLADGSKFGLSAHITFADIEQVTLITAQGDKMIDYTPYQRVTEVHVL